ncbi:MAG: uracil-DNA glycosylase [Ignavibacteriales bacterium]|nr:uracil-DNA glycosylase [Ignavibacteriales bacterium]
MENNINPVREALLLQQEMFGDELFILKGAIHQNAAPHTAAVQKVEPTAIVTETAPAISVPTVPVTLSDYINTTSLDALFNATCNCQNCVLGKSRKTFVFGKGSPNAKVMIIGEGPGADEDVKGEPFVGKAGQLLTDILRAIKFTREEVYIANIVKCRPPGNRTPEQNEIASCLPYLEKQIELIKPELILCLGATAALGLLKKKETLGRLRKNVFSYNNIQVMVTYHPAALLRNPAWKKDCWEDVQAFRALYDKREG